MTLRQWIYRNQPSSFIRVPLPLGGRLFLSPMPYGPYDPGHSLMKLYHRNKIDMAVVLVTNEEIALKCKKNLWAEYRRNRIATLHYPVKDLTAPLDLRESGIIEKISSELNANHIAIHCNAGVGRTAVIAACIVKNLLELKDDKAIDYIQNITRIDITSEQRWFVKEW